MAPRPDLTLIMTAHSEGSLAHPSVKSAQAAVAHARAHGAVVECLAGLDDPAAETEALGASLAASGWSVSTYMFRDQGLARNALVREATGQFLAFLDADDLIGEEWLTRAFAAAKDAGPDQKVIHHPEVVWQFGRVSSVVAPVASTNPSFSPHYLTALNPFDAMCFGPRAAWVDHPFPPRDIAAGVAFEDWHWVVETLATGWAHDTVRDTVMFKRRRAGSQGAEARSNRALMASHPALSAEGFEDLVRMCDARRNSTT